MISFSLLTNYRTDTPLFVGLMEAGRIEEGRRVLARLHGQAFADASTIEIQEAIAVEHAAQRGKGYAECFAKCVKPRERRFPFCATSPSSSAG